MKKIDTGKQIIQTTPCGKVSNLLGKTIKGYKLLMAYKYPNTNFYEYTALNLNTGKKHAWSIVGDSKTARDANYRMNLDVATMYKPLSR